MALSEILLSPDNQQFSMAVKGSSYSFRVLWRDICWVLDISDGTGSAIISSIPLVTGTDLMEPFNHLGLGFSLLVVCDVPGQDYPTETDLGTRSHLYIITE
ncbi:phage baseplate plug family protein [Pantoea ananatis]